MIDHILPETCPKCGEVVRNDMAVQHERGRRMVGHVQFACNYEIEIQSGKEPTVIRDCKKGQTWPHRT